MNNDFLPRRHRQPPFAAHPRQSQTPQESQPTQDRHPFKTPEAVAAEEEPRQPGPYVTDSGAVIGHHGPPPKQSQFQKVRDRLRTLTRKQWILIGIMAAVVAGSGGFALYYFVFRDTAPPVTTSSVPKKTKPKPEPQPTTVPSTLTGLPVDPGINARPVTAVMIENSKSARPQAGIIEAGVVFEAIAEGGITRFLTLFQDTSPEYIGPVRSVRPYYIQWLNGFDAAVAHVGGSAEALAMLRQPGGKDLDQFFNTGPYWRVSNRAAPHNMYSSVTKLRELQIAKGWGTSTYTGFARTTKESPSAQPSARVIHFNISGALYNSHYDYDPATNSYLRSEGGAPHTDEKTGQQITAKVVVGLVMAQGKNGVYTTYGTIGSGHLFVFQDGVVTQGTWEKTSNASQFTFKDASGAAIQLNPGKTWITVVGGTDRVTYQP